jgi:Pin2-interacting protein X1
LTRRIKISHDPNNLNWAQSAESYGQKLLASQGWRPGQGLGAHGVRNFNSPVSAIKITYKDDTLGLGASLKSANAENRGTGLDAFQGLLGRLNSKDEAEAKKLEQKAEDRKLVMWTQGKWGGVMFVPGGLLVQGDKFRKWEDAGKSAEAPTEETVETEGQRPAEKAANAVRREARRARKEARRKKGEGQESPDSGQGVEDSTTTPPAPGKSKQKQTSGKRKVSLKEIAGTESSAIASADKSTKKTKNKEKRSSDSASTNDVVQLSVEKSVALDAGQLPTPPSEARESPTAADARSGRHVIRGRNIQAKRMAFADAKMLDEVRSPRITGFGGPLLTNDQVFMRKP